MNVLYNLVLRNIRIYLRDKAAVFFSFLSVIIILALYILFLGKMQTDRIASLGVDGLDWLVSSWIMAGILTVSTVTVPLGAIGNLIDDRADGLINDFYTSPIKRNILALSYLISAWVIGFIMVMVNFAIGQIYVLVQGGELMSFMQLIQILGVVIISIMTFSSFFFYLSMFIRTRNAYGLLATLVSTFIGFLGGIYIAIGDLGDNVQAVMNVLPTAHAVTLIRRIYMEGAVNMVFGGTTSTAYTEYADHFGLNIAIGSFELTSFHMLLSMIIFMIVFFVLSVIKLSRTKL